jgi:hypothetical protein
VSMAWWKQIFSLHQAQCYPPISFLIFHVLALTYTYHWNSLCISFPCGQVTVTSHTSLP